MRIRSSVRTRYRIVARLLAGRGGTLLDVGARDQRLKNFLDPARIRYAAADCNPGLDYRIDLENPLSLADRSFDHVVALDVLEHVEEMHAALRALARLPRQTLIISLPNISACRQRLSFLLRGRLDTGKYDLLPRYQGDRHRCVTTIPAMDRFIAEVGREEGFDLVEIVDELDGSLPCRFFLAALRAPGLATRAFAAERSVYLLERR